MATNFEVAESLSSIEPTLEYVNPSELEGHEADPLDGFDEFHDFFWERDIRDLEEGMNGCDTDDEEPDEM